MSTQPHPPEDQAAPRWLLALVGFGAAVLLVGATLGWLYRGSAIVLDMANFFCF